MTGNYEGRYVGSRIDTPIIAERKFCTWQGGDPLEPEEMETTCAYVFPYHLAVIAKAKSNLCPFCSLPIVDITEF